MLEGQDGLQCIEDCRGQARKSGEGLPLTGRVGGPREDPRDNPQSGTNVNQKNIENIKRIYLTRCVFFGMRKKNTDLSKFRLTSVFQNVTMGGDAESGEQGYILLREPPILFPRYPYIYLGIVHGFPVPIRILLRTYPTIFWIFWF